MECCPAQSLHAINCIYQVLNAMLASSIPETSNTGSSVHVLLGRSHTCLVLIPLVVILVYTCMVAFTC